VIDFTGQTKEWAVKRVDGRELFIAPDGTQYVRTRSADGADAKIELTKHIVSTVYLRRDSETAILDKKIQRERRQERLAEKRAEARRASRRPKVTP